MIILLAALSCLDAMVKVKAPTVANILDALHLLFTLEWRMKSQPLEVLYLESMTAFGCSVDMPACGSIPGFSRETRYNDKK